tara:strand:+ start:3584 stop:4975 length:1392 start_codon:yes stop_codon:yes gene_type:complete
VLLVTVVLGGVSEVGLKKGHAQSVEPFTIRDSGVQSQFPEGLTFTIDIQSEIRIDDVRVTFEVGARGTTQYAYLDLDQSNRPLINGEWFQRTNSNDRYIPPGSMIKYWFEIIDENGDSYFTEPETWRFDDSRFEWDEVTVGTVTVLYHGPVRTRAERLATAAIQSLELMAEVTGADTQTPIVMVLYNNNAEMIEAVVAKSLASSRELITEGQAFDAESVVLVLAGRSDVGTATHEMTHILVARAAGSRASVPLWLNEGLAEYGNLDQTISYERFLEWAVGTDRLIPLKSLRSFPGDPNLTLVAYGQGRSVVKYMIDEFGTEKMSELLATLGTAIGIDDALGAVYGFGIRGLEDKWRESIGADPYIEPTPGPTPTPSADPTPTYRLLTQPPESVELEPESVRADQPTESPEVLDSSSERDHSTADEVSLSARGAIHQFVALMFIILSLMLFVAHSYAFRIKRDS